MCGDADSAEIISWVGGKWDEAVEDCRGWTVRVSEETAITAKKQIVPNTILNVVGGTRQYYCRC